MVRITRLDNGLKVASVAVPHMVSVSVGFWVGVGGRHEPARWCGISHFLEHLLFKGTARRSARQISQDIEGLGGELNAFTTEEHTCYFSKALHPHLRDLVDVLGDMCRWSRLAPADIGTEREVIKEELAMYLDQPHHFVQDLLNETLWPNHPLGRSLTGTVETLDGMRRADLRAYLDRHYQAGNIWIVAAGRVRHPDLLDAVAAFARGLPPGQRPAFEPAPPPQSRPRVRHVVRETEQTQLALGVPTFCRHDPRRYALRLLSTMLGENMSSRLFQTLREERGLVYSVGSALVLFADAGALTVSAGLDPGRLPTVLRLILEEFGRFRTCRVGAAELDRARDYLIGQMELSLESSNQQMMWMGEQLLDYGRWISASEIRRRLHEVTPAQVRAAAIECLHPDRLNLALVSPRAREPQARRLLADFPL